MPAVGETRRRIRASTPKPKKAKPQPKPVVRPPDAGDPARGRPEPAPTKVRQYAHPQRKGPQKAFREAERDAAKVQRGQVRRATAARNLKTEVSRIKVTPVPSPDARDTLRSPAQKSRDAAVVAASIRTSRQAFVRKRKHAQGKALLTGDPVKDPRYRATPPKGYHYDDAGKLRSIDPDKWRKDIERRELQRAERVAPVVDILEETTRPLHAVAAAAKHDVQQVKKHGITGAVGHGSLGAAKRGIQNKDKSTFSDVFTEAGWKPKGTLGKIAKGAASFGADVILDPTTLTTGGTTSVARKAAITTARKVERSAARSAGAQVAREKATQQAVRQGATPKAAKVAGKQAVRVHARRAGKATGEAAKVGKPTNTGLTIRFGGRDIPGITRATSAAKRGPRAVARKTGVERTRVGQKVDRAQQKVRDTSRNFASDFNPAIAPAGVDRELYQAARRSARTARAGAQRGTFRAGQRAIAFRKAIGPKNYTKVIDAIETGTIETLPKELRGPARELQQDFAKMLKAERRAGLKVGDKGEKYVKHLRIKPEPRGGVPRVGDKTVSPSFGKSRIEGTIAEKNLREPGAYSEDIADIYANRGAESAVARSKAKLNQAMVNAGRKPDRSIPIKHQLGDNETLYKIEGANLVKVDAKSTEAKTLPKDGKYVILNEKLISRTRGTVASAAERSTAGVVFDKAQGVWKLTATQVNPGYHVRNLAGEAQNAYLAENPIILGRNAIQAARALRQLGRDEEALRVLGKTPKGKRYEGIDIKTAESVGAVRAGQLGREVGEMLGGASKKSGPVKVRRGVLRKPARALKNVEDVFRLASYKGGLDRGLTPEQAMERASRYHFDYGDLTPLERNVLRRAFPFWTFSSRNIPLQARALLTTPGKYANYQKVRENFQKAFGIPDDWEKDVSPSEQRSAAIPVKINGKTYGISLGPSGLPLTDLNEFPTTGDPVKQIDEWINRGMSMLTPGAKTPVEIWSNMSYFFRAPIEKDTGSLVPAPSWVQYIPEKYRKELGITDKYRNKQTGKSTWGAPAKLVYALGVLPGPIAFANRMMTQSDKPGQTKTSQAVQYVGPRVRQTDPVGVRINQLFAEKAKLTKDIETLEQTNHPDGTPVTRTNPTPEYRKLYIQRKKVEADLLRKRIARGDKGLIKPRRGNSELDVELPNLRTETIVP